MFSRMKCPDGQGGRKCHKKVAQLILACKFGLTFNLPGLHPIIGEKISIRVNGIDTPEIKGKCDKEKYDAQQAKEMVADIIKDAEVITLKNMRRGKYFRIAADVIVDGESLGEILVEAGMAIKYGGGKKTHQWCK